MKKTIKLGILSIIICGIIYVNNDYMDFKNRKCIIIDKVISSGKYSGNFYLILKEENNIIFDLIVSATTYNQAKKGDIKFFKLRQMDIKQTPFENLVYFIIPIILFSISLSILLTEIILKIIKI